MIDYHRWISAGLPHRIGADPDDGEGIDCLVMCHKLRTAAGLATPPLDPAWFTMAADGHWPQLEREWRRLMEHCNPEPYALLLYPQPYSLGVSILIDNGILMVHHRRGCQWIPLAVADRIMPLQYWRPKHAAAI